MIYIDKTEDFRLLQEFKAFDVPVESTSLEFGDLCFAGNGPQDTPVMIGLERKRIGDLFNSIRSKRLAGKQILGMLETYPHAAYLIVEGIWQPGKNGEVECRSGAQWSPLMAGSSPISYLEVDHFLATMEECGIRVYRCPTMTETAAYVTSRFKWWNDKSYDEHKAHLSIYAPVPDALMGQSRKASFRPQRPNKMVKVAAQIDGIENRAWQAGQYFKTPQELALAGEDEWREALGFKEVGKIVKQVVAWWRE